MPVKDCRDGQLRRLSDSEYAAQYLLVSLDEALTDGDIEGEYSCVKKCH